MRIVYMGTPEFAIPSLQGLIDAGYTPIAVVTGPDKQRGRGRRITPTPVKEVALRNGIPVIQPESVKDPAFAEEIAALGPDLIVVVAFRILPPAVFNEAKLGAFNLHGSLLPRFRGAAPIQRSLMEGVDETGVTTFFLREKVDTGNVILQRAIPVGPNETAGELHDRLAELGAEVVLETVRLIERGEAAATVQNDALATPAPKISKDDCLIDWSRPAGAVHNQIRALSPFPGAWTAHDDTRLKILRTVIGPDTNSAAPGVVIDVDGCLTVACGSGSVDILELQREGKSRVSATDFLNGYPLRRGDRLS